MHKTIKHLVSHSAKHNPQPHPFDEYQARERIELIMERAIIAGIRGKHEELVKADGEYFTVTGHHVSQDIKRYLARHNLAHHYINGARK